MTDDRINRVHISAMVPLLEAMLIGGPPRRRASEFPFISQKDTYRQSDADKQRQLDKAQAKRERKMKARTNERP